MVWPTLGSRTAKEQNRTLTNRSAATAALITTTTVTITTGLPSDTWFPEPTQVLNRNGISIGSAVFAGLTSVTDRPTDHTTCSVTTGCIYVRSTAMQPNNNNLFNGRPGTRKKHRLTHTLPYNIFC